MVICKSHDEAAIKEPQHSGFDMLRPSTTGRDNHAEEQDRASAQTEQILLTPRKKQPINISIAQKRSRAAPARRWSAIVAIALGAQFCGLPPLHAEEKPEKKITDSGITAAVESGLIFEKGVFPNDVDVSTTEGIVTLSGSGENILIKERAVKIAETIRGVRGVIDRIAVTPVSRPDADIRKDVLTALLQDPATDSYQVSASVKDGVATLSGSVGSYAEKQLASRIAKGVKGIKEIQNDVVINYTAKHTDAEIAGDVKSRLQWDIWINGDLINADVKDGKVTLSGTVGSVMGKTRALEDGWVDGATSVDDSSMKIEPSVSEDEHRKLKYTVRSDSEIKQAVEASFRLDPRVSAFSPGVTVEGGAVVLGGAVGNVKAKTSAEQDVKNVVGVWQVDNLLKVRPKGQATDLDVQNQLKAALFWDPMLDSSTIDVAVINHVAYLSGAVDSRSKRAEAEDVASRTKGVVLVRNHLKTEPEYSIYSYDWPSVPYYDAYSDWPYYNSPPYFSEVFQSPPYLSDEQIKKKITDAFFWSPFVHFDDVKAVVNGGVATLTGTVGTWIGWGEADRDARKSGATAVLNHIDVKKGAWSW